jgi:hypothetical protein
MEWGAVIFWGWCPTKQLSDPMVIFLVSYIYFFEENGSFNYVQIYPILSKNHKKF